MLLNNNNKGASPIEAELQTHTFFVGLAFMSIFARSGRCTRQRHPLILKDTFHVRDSYIGGIVMAAWTTCWRCSCCRCSASWATRPARKSAAVCRTYWAAPSWRFCASPSCHSTNRINAHTAVLHRLGWCSCHDHLPQPRRGLMPDVTMTPAQRGQRRHQPDGRRGHADTTDDDDLSNHRDTPRYSAVFLVLGLVMAVCVAVLFWQIREPACVAEREAADRAAGSSDEDEGVTDAGGKMPRPMFRSLLFILASVFFWFFGYNAVTSAFSRYAEQELQGNFALVLMICTVAAIVSYMPVGMIAQRIGRKRTILIGIVMLGTAFFAGIFFHSVSPLLYIFFALAGMGWAFINVNSYPMVVELSKGSDVEAKCRLASHTVSMTAADLYITSSPIF